MKDHVEIGHLTKYMYDASRVNRDQVMDLEILFKIDTNVSNFEKVSPKPNKILKFLYQFCDHCKILSYTFYLKEAEMKITMFVHFKEYLESHKNFKSSFDFGGCCLKIREVCVDFEPYFKVHNLLSVQSKNILVLVSVYQWVKI